MGPRFSWEFVVFSEVPTHVNKGKSVAFISINTNTSHSNSNLYLKMLELGLETGDSPVKEAKFSDSGSWFHGEKAETGTLSSRIKVSDSFLVVFTDQLRFWSIWNHRTSCNRRGSRENDFEEVTGFRSSERAAIVEKKRRKRKKKDWIRLLITVALIKLKQEKSDWKKKKKSLNRSVCWNLS